MDHAVTMGRLYELISAGDIDGLGDCVADDFVEHEEMPGLEPSKEGVKRSSTCTGRRPRPALEARTTPQQ